MEKLKYIKIEHEDGTLSENVPVGADAANIDVTNDKDLATKLNELDAKDTNIETDYKNADAGLRKDVDANKTTITGCRTDINTLTSRVDNLSTLEEGSTTGDAELIDARIDYRGKIYTNVGENIRFHQYKNSNINNQNFDLVKGLWEIGGIAGQTGELVEHEEMDRTDFFTIDYDMDYFRIIIKDDSVIKGNNFQIMVFDEEKNFLYTMYLREDNRNAVKAITNGEVYFDNWIATQKQWYRIAYQSTSSQQAILNLTSDNIQVFQGKIEYDNHIQPINLIYNGTLGRHGNWIDMNPTTNRGGISHNSSYPEVFYKVKPGEQIWGYNWTAVNILLDKDKKCIARYQNDSPLQATHVWTVPDNCYYILHHIAINTSAFIDTRFFEDNKSIYTAQEAGDKLGNLQTKELLDAEKFIKDGELDKKIAALNYIKYGEEEGIIVNTSSLKGKKINCLGDSITSTNYTRPCWGEIIAERTGCTINNYGISATTLAHCDDRHFRGIAESEQDPNYDPNNPDTWSTGNCFVERFSRMTSDADAIVVMGGTNDGPVPIGDWKSTNLNDFYGGLDNLIRGLLKMYPGKPILFCTMMQNSSAYSSNVIDPLSTLKGQASTATVSLQLRAEAIKVKCKQYGLPCLDLFNESGINGADDDKIYFRTNDSLHPSATGQERLANLIQDKLEELFN